MESLEAKVAVITHSVRIGLGLAREFGRKACAWRSPMFRRST